MSATSKDQPPVTATTDAPKRLEELVRQAEVAAASDIHLQMAGRSAQVSFRLDGVMTPAATLAEDIADRVFGRIKFLAHLKTYQDSMPQDGRIDKADLGARQDIRVATYPTVTGEKIVLRLFNDATAKSLNELEFPAPVMVELENYLRANSGLLLLTGPAGSGKTTTIYACLRSLAEMGGRHIITVEDPAEQILPGIMQTEVSDARGLTFAKAARHLLRQDPQVLVLGEIRDEETANIAVRAALTGHLMISTLHAGSCRGVLERLLVMCPDHSILPIAGALLHRRPASQAMGQVRLLRVSHLGQTGVAPALANETIAARFLGHAGHPARRRCAGGTGLAARRGKHGQPTLPPARHRRVGAIAARDQTHRGRAAT